MGWFSKLPALSKIFGACTLNDLGQKKSSCQREQIKSFKASFLIAVNFEQWGQICHAPRFVIYSFLYVFDMNKQTFLCGSVSVTNTKQIGAEEIGWFMPVSMAPVPPTNYSLSLPKQNVKATFVSSWPRNTDLTVIVQEINAFPSVKIPLQRGQVSSVAKCSLLTITQIEQPAISRSATGKKQVDLKRFLAQNLPKCGVLAPWIGNEWCWRGSQGTKKEDRFRTFPIFC